MSEIDVIFTEIDVEDIDVILSVDEEEIVFVFEIPNVPYIPAGGRANRYNIYPVGMINGVNVLFTTPEDFFINTTRVYLNGVRQNRDNDYTEIGNNAISFLIAPLAGDALLLDYEVG